MLFSENKVEIELRKYKNAEMATLVARRLHKFANDKSNTEYCKLGLRFIISESGGKTSLYIASTKLRALDSRTVYIFNQLAQTYDAILEPFFSKR